MTSRAPTRRSWWMTAQTAVGASAQLPLWLVLMALTTFALQVDPSPQWWLALTAWTAGLVASCATAVSRSGVVPEGALRPVGAAGVIGWGLLVVTLGLVAVGALTLFVTTGHPVAWLAASIVGAVTVWIAVRGSRRRG